MTVQTLNQIHENMDAVVEAMQNSGNAVDVAMANLLEACVEADDRETMEQVVYAHEDRLTEYANQVQA